MYIDSTLFDNFLKAKDITWIGIDFSQAMFTKNGFEMLQDAAYHFFQDLNHLIISDQKKYDIRLSFRKPVMYYDLSLVAKKNKAVKMSTRLVNKLFVSHQFKEEFVIDYVSSFEIDTETEFALTFVVESFDKNSKTASVWVVLFDNFKHKIILCEKFMKSPGGLNITSYWARVFYNLLFDIKSHSFERWRNLIEES